MIVLGGVRMAEGGNAVRDEFGTLANGRSVEIVTLANGAGTQARLITYGASIQSMLVRDRHGALADVALGHDTIEPYLSQPQYFGSTVGRVANRIAGGRFTLEGVDYQTPVNNGPNSLHGGDEGFDKKIWDIVEISDGPRPSVTMRLVSPDGDQGYPGTLVVTATYTLDDEDNLSVDYIAVTDRPTIVNLSNHAYWNLAGEGSADGAMDHRLIIDAEHYLPTDEAAIPTGDFRAVENSPVDFRRPARVGDRVRDAGDLQIRHGRGYDHAWAIAREPSEDVRRLARLEDPRSGRVMELLSNQPSVQFYSGNFLDATTIGKGGQLYRMGDAIVLEPQLFPDTPNQPQFGSARLDPGQTYRNRIVWRFSTGASDD